MTESSQHLIENLQKLTRFQKQQIANWNEKLGIVLSQLNAQQNSLQTISNTLYGFHSLTGIITERFDNTQKAQSNLYLRECQEETTLNNTDRLIASLQRDNQNWRQKIH